MKPRKLLETPKSLKNHNAVGNDKRDGKKSSELGNQQPSRQNGGRFRDSRSGRPNGQDEGDDTVRTTTQSAAGESPSGEENLRPQGVRVRVPQGPPVKNLTRKQIRVRPRNKNVSRISVRVSGGGESKT